MHNSLQGIYVDTGKIKHTVNAVKTLINDMEKLGASWEKRNI
jgi:chemotaxis receptor (MCP) glutamine deamidase CheD